MNLIPIRILFDMIPSGGAPGARFPKTGFHFADHALDCRPDCTRCALAACLCARAERRVPRLFVVCVLFYFLHVPICVYRPRMETEMGLLDNLRLGDMLKSLLGQGESSALPTLINAVLAKTEYRDLNGLVAALQKGGLDEQVKSWLGPGANLPITAEQLKAVLGNAQVQDFARQLGLPVDQALKTMAQYLPEIVDKASPNGVLKAN
jgi:uncharacterized protein YidB (DUF937 family)